MKFDEAGFAKAMQEPITFTIERRQFGVLSQMALWALIFMQKRLRDGEPIVPAGMGDAEEAALAEAVVRLHEKIHARQERETINLKLLYGDPERRIITKGNDNG